jgi:hypothetical protein
MARDRQYIINRRVKEYGSKPKQVQLNVTSVLALVQLCS